MSETAENKVKFSFKNLSLSKKILFISVIVVVAAAIALSIALPLTLGQNKVPEPYFMRFDQLSDSEAILAWNKVKGASSYLVEYYYEGQDPVSSYVTGTRLAIDRRYGVLYARVKANVGEEIFSEYARLEITELTLGAPSVSLNGLGVAEWTNVYYRYRGERVAVKNYSVEITIGDSPSIVLERETLSMDLSDMIVLGIPYQEGLEEQGIEWEDVTVTVRVKALVTINAIYTPTTQEKYLKGAYVEGDFGSTSLTVTKEIYEGIKE